LLVLRGETVSREQTVAMYRVKNEARWLRRSLERTFEVAATAVVLDDHSTDETGREAFRALGDYDVSPEGWQRGTVHDMQSRGNRLVYAASPFHDARPGQYPHEIVDRQYLWDLARTHTDAPYLLSLDGDEVLSKAAVRAFPVLWDSFSRGIADVFKFRFAYLWDEEWLQRVDSWYRSPSFPRMMSVAHLTQNQVRGLRFPMTANTLHGGSLPTDGYVGAGPNDSVRTGQVNNPIVHFGYFDEELRQRKFEWYRKIDPGNVNEGEYLHIIGLPDRWCPTTPVLDRFEDA
jgi:hypothetical protein